MLLEFRPSHPLASQLHFKHFPFPISGTKLDSAATAALQIRVPQLNPVSLKQPEDTRNIQSISKYRNTLFLLYMQPSEMLCCSDFRALSFNFSFFGAMIQISCSSFTQIQ